MNLPEPFAYPPQPHVRQQAPAGYQNYQDYKPWLRDEFAFRCVYCLQRETWSRERHAIFSVDHIIPQSEAPALVSSYANLVYACLRCNSAKQGVSVLDPTRVAFALHLRAEADGTVTGLTDEGKFLVELLHLNGGAAPAERRRIARILQRHDQYPSDQGIQTDFQETFGYPEDLPDLPGLRPPGGNSLQENEAACHRVRRDKGLLPPIY